MTEQFAPSEEFSLFCDVPGCPASLSMVSQVSRSEHGWGRCTVYDDTVADAHVVIDYDLCTAHFTALRHLLKGDADAGAQH